MIPFARITATGLAIAAGLLVAPAPAGAVVIVSGDPVLYWNQVMLGGLTPAHAIRGYAMVNIAMHDAVNATLGGPNTAYLSGIVAPGGDTRAAAAPAARDVLVQLNPAMTAQFDAALASSLALIVDGAAKANGIATGAAFAAGIIANRAGDGAFDIVTYSASGLPGRYALTPPGFGAPINQQWGDVDPFLLGSPSQFRAPPPPALGSQTYADAFNEVKAIGSAVNDLRTADQTAAARFWGTSNGATYFGIAFEAASNEGLSTIENARLFALLGAGIADTLITLWDSKAHYDFWRPSTAIQNAGVDGNPLTDADPGWAPLIAAPPHQSYISAHSGLGVLASTVLLSAIGDEALCSTQGLNTRCWPGLEAMAIDGANSRLWGGIHYSFDRDAGLVAGRQVAGVALGGRVFNAVPEPATWAMMIAGFALVGVSVRRRGGGYAIA